ncbi:MAG: hypothetical protein GTO22_07215 [Gemmatimonadales bacterium]|nr:hypothetical protein [Gemmatimonadales bacterium]
MLRIALFLALAITWGGSVQAQETLVPLDPWVRQVHQQLWMYRTALDLTDLSHNIVTGSLDDGDSETVQAELEGGSSYAILAVCDNDCSDIDLRIRSRSSGVLDEDIELDDFPVVQVSVAGEGAMNFQVEVIMASCSASPCRYGVAVFEQ